MPQCSYPPYRPLHQRRLANCDWMSASYTSGQPSHPRSHLTWWASLQREPRCLLHAVPGETNAQTQSSLLKPFWRRFCVVLECPIHRPPHGLHGLTVLVDDTIDWQLNTCPRSSAAKQWLVRTTCLKEEEGCLNFKIFLRSNVTQDRSGLRAKPPLHFGRGNFHEISFDDVIVLVQPWYNFFSNRHI